MKNKLLIPLIATSLMGGLSLNIAHGAILFEDGFENRSLSKWNISGNAPKVTNSPIRSGNYAVHSNLDRAKDKKSYRTELSMKSKTLFKMGQEYWIAASIFIPSNWGVDHYDEILLQFHGLPDTHLGEKWSGRNPPVSLSILGSQWRLKNSSDSRPVTKDKKYSTKGYSLGPYKKGQWTDWVFRIKWSYKNDGILEVWKDGQKVVTQNGPNTFNDKQAPYLKLGIYKPSWIPGVTWASKSSGVKTRTVHHDNIRIGDSRESYSTISRKR